MWPDRVGVQVNLSSHTTNIDLNSEYNGEEHVEADEEEDGDYMCLFEENEVEDNSNECSQSDAYEGSEGDESDSSDGSQDDGSDGSQGDEFDSFEGPQREDSEGDEASQDEGHDGDQDNAEDEDPLSALFERLCSYIRAKGGMNFLNPVTTHMNMPTPGVWNSVMWTLKLKTTIILILQGDA